MNVFLLGIRVTDKAILEDGKANVIAEALPSSNKRVTTKVQLIQKADHYVGKLLQDLEEKQEVLETIDIRSRLERLMSFLEAEIDLLQVEKRIRGRVKRQIEKSQRSE